MATSTRSMKQKAAALPASHLPTAFLAAAAVLAMIGLAAWIYQLIQGMQVTGLSQQVVWGAYIAAFFTAVGAGAALLALAGLSEFTPALPLAARSRVLAAALGAFISGGLLITMDVGNPLQLWRIVAAFRFSSMMTWDFWLLAISVVVAAAYLLTIKGEQPAKVQGTLAIAAAVLVVAVEGWMLSSQAARTMWGSGMTLVAFLAGAAVAGLGIAALLLPKDTFLRKALAGALALSLLLALAEVLTGLFSGDPRVREEISLVLTGSAAPFFWFQLVIGLALPLWMALSGGNLAIAGALAAAGVLAEKVWMLSTGQAQPWLALPTGAYSASWVELAAVVGAVALGVVVYELIWKWASAR